jgi:cobalt/nickel transport system ATP-binding protein
VILSARGLRFTYPGGIDALAGLDLDVPEGGRLAILGPNGAGKTTLLMHLNGTLRPGDGEVRLAGRPVAYDRRSLTRWRTMVGLVLQDPDDQLFAGSVHQDVSFGPLNLGLTEREVRDRVDGALAAMRISDLARRLIHMLSFGQKKRVAIAGVLAMKPRVLILDEPTGGLDPHGVAHLLAALGHLVAAGTTIVYTTHDVDLACAWSDAVAVFHRGRVIGHGRPEHVLAEGELLRRAHLRLPLALEVGLRARELGLVEADAPLPRSRADVADLLERMAGRSNSIGVVNIPPEIGRGGLEESSGFLVKDRSYRGAPR